MRFLTRRAHRLLPAALLVASLAFAGGALADGAEGFLHTHHDMIESLLRQPASDAREGQLSSIIDGMVDYDELTRRSFGEPCPASLSGCKDYWAGLDEGQRKQVRDLLRQLVEKNYRKNLVKTLDYEITYKGARDLGGESKILTEAKSKLKPRDPSVRVDYVIRSSGNAFRIVDIHTEGSSLVKNYYDQFKKMMETPDQGFPYILTKLQKRIDKQD